MLGSWVNPYPAAGHNVMCFNAQQGQNVWF
jgi:hypothetical protein